MHAGNRGPRMCIREVDFRCSMRGVCHLRLTGEEMETEGDGVTCQVAQEVNGKVRNQTRAG